jgi:hypothetical protein
MLCSRNGDNPVAELVRDALSVNRTADKRLVAPAVCHRGEKLMHNADNGKSHLLPGPL